MAQRRDLWNGLKLILLHVSSSKVSSQLTSIVILKGYLDRDPEYCTYIDRYFGNKSVILEAEMELLKHVKGYFRDFPSLTLKTFIEIIQFAFQTRAGDLVALSFSNFVPIRFNTTSIYTSFCSHLYCNQQYILQIKTQRQFLLLQGSFFLIGCFLLLQERKVYYALLIHVTLIETIQIN